jgi:hypothetical protein
MAGWGKNFAPKLAEYRLGLALKSALRDFSWDLHPTCFLFIKTYFGESNRKRANPEEFYGQCD